jgi:Icc-related predicted phosphoesterase
MPECGVVELSDKVCLIGHGSWADGRLGDFAGSTVMLGDYRYIKEFTDAGSSGRLNMLNTLGDQAAEYLRKTAADALEKYSHVIVLTHTPPFRKACWYRGRASDDNWLPHFSCMAAGKVLKEAIQNCPDKKMTVLCGHTHSRGTCHILPNLEVKTGGAKYSSPAIEEFIDIDK